MADTENKEELTKREELESRAARANPELPESQRRLAAEQSARSMPMPSERAQAPDLSRFPTRGEVQTALNGLMGRMAALLVTKAELKGITTYINSVVVSLKNLFVTRREAKQIAREAVPLTLRNLDSSLAQRTGNFLKLLPGGTTGGPDSAYWGTAQEFEPKGSKVLYKSAILREYDAAGNIVAIDSELQPSDYLTQTAYEAALTAADHKLIWTIDHPRAHG